MSQPATAYLCDLLILLGLKSLHENDQTMAKTLQSLPHFEEIAIKSQITNQITRSPTLKLQRWIHFPFLVSIFPHHHVNNIFRHATRHNQQTMESLCKDHHRCTCRRCQYRQACYRFVATANYDPKNVVAILFHLKKVGDAICGVVQFHKAAVHVERDVCASLVLVMKRHATKHEAIAQTSLRVLGLFVRFCEEARCRLIVVGICPVMIDVIKHQGSKNRDVAMWSCGAVTLLLRQRDARGPGARFVINQRVFDPLICKVLVAAVRAHHLHWDTVTWVPAIAALCYDNTDVNRGEFQKLGVEMMLRGLTYGKRGVRGGAGKDAVKGSYVPSADMKEYTLEVADMLL